MLSFCGCSLCVRLVSSALSLRNVSSWTNYTKLPLGVNDGVYGALHRTDAHHATDFGSAKYKVHAKSEFSQESFLLKKTLFIFPLIV